MLIWGARAATTGGREKKMKQKRAKHSVTTTAMPVTLAVVTGTITSAIQITDGGGARFTIRNGDGHFFIKVRDLGQVSVCQTMKAGDRVYIVGQLHSFVSKRCTSHHVYVEAQVVLPLNVLLVRGGVDSLALEPANPVM